MLQGLNLPFIEVAPLENGLNYSVTLPEQGLATATTFADIFKLEPPAPTLLPHSGGAHLPEAGNILPLGLNDAPVATAIDALESDRSQSDRSQPDRSQPDLLQTEVLATNPLPLTPMSPAITPVQISLNVRQTAAPVAPGVMPGRSDTLPIPLATQEISGDLMRPAATPGSPQVLNERGNLFVPGNIESPRPLPSVQAAVARSVVDLPLLPVNGEAVANVREQVTMSKKMPLNYSELRPAIEQASSPKPLPEATSDNQLQPVKPLPTMPSVVQPAALTPVASGSGETLLGQQMQISTLQVAAPANRSGAEINVSTPQTPALIETPVNESAWGDRVGDRLLLMANNKMQSAEIRLTPAELGPLRVRISLDDGTASVNFHAQHAVTRDALEQAMPRLRELFAENGLTLQQGDIAESDGNGVQQGKQDQDNHPSTGDASGAVVDDVAADNTSNESAMSSRSDQLVDTFA